MHGKKRSIEDIYLIYFPGRNNPHRPCQRFFLNDFAQGIPLFFGQLLGIVQQFVLKIFGKNNGCGIDSTGKAAAPRFVTSRFYQFLI